jgi:hypothetical protein
MRISFFLAALLLLPGCAHFLSKIKVPLQIKAVLEGEIKGHKIHCEKTLALDKGQWGIMCAVGNDMEVQYRINTLQDGQALVEFVVSKEKQPGERKIIAAPSLIVKNNHSAENVTTTDTSTVMVRAERFNERQ